MREQIENYFAGTYADFYQKYLKKIKKLGGDEYQALCPFHDDTNPSFNFNNQTGKYFCHGCNKKGHIVHFYAKINNLNDKRDYPKILKGIADDFGIPWEEKKAKMIKAYDYTDSDGNLLFQVCRMEPKDFRQRRPNGNGNWIWDIKGITPVLYNLSGVLKADEVIIVEGEKDVDCASKMGLTATTCPMGAGKWREEYNNVLTGKDIILIPDNDSEGREHMVKVAISLNGKAKSLKWIDLAGVRSKGDLFDWAAQFDDSMDASEQLCIMIEKAGPYEPPQKKSLEDIVITVREFRAIERPPREVFLSPWLKKLAILLITGWRGIGKTWFVLALLNAVNSGKSFGPWKCDTQAPCLFLDGEMPQEDIDERDKALDLNPDLYIYSDAYANEFGLPKAHLANESWRTKMKSILVTKGIKLWAIDNLASLAMGLDENSKKDWDPINAWLLDLRFAGISTIMLHHENKEGGQRGTSAREDNIDVSISLKKPHDYNPDDGARFIVHFTKARVATRDLPLITDVEFKLTQDENGRHNWTWADVKGERKRDILRMLDEGVDGSTIAETLGISKQAVSKAKARAIKDGHLNRGGKLTQTGFWLISNDEKG
jgi:hypothetical protein